MGSSCSSFMLTNLKNWLVVTENRIYLFNYFSECSTLEKQDVGRRMFRPITKEVFLWRMSMEIKIKLKSSLVFLFQTCGKLIKSIYLRINKLVELVELSVEIFSTVTSPKVTSHNTIRVEHGNDVKNIHVSKLYRNFIIFQ